MTAAPVPASPEGQDFQPALLRVLVDRLPAMVAYWDADQRCRFANRAYKKWFGIDASAMVGIEMRELLGPLYELNLPYIEGVLRGEEQEFERVIPDPAGGPSRHSLANYVPDVVDGKVRGFCVVVTDITRLKKAESALRDAEHQLQASERLAGLATLAAGIAHEINNPLAAVLGSIELALENLTSASPDLASARADLAVANDSALRVRDIVQSMKLLARGETTDHRTVDVNDMIQKSLDFAAPSLRYKARIVRDLQPRCYVDANPSQLAQVFVNLLTNAAQALPDDKVGTNEIRVATRREGDLVIVEVKDNGCGIPQDLQARVFEPFFTTKAVGAGMGLGLSISSAIVKAFNGTLSVESLVGQGSLFRVVLPASHRATAASGPAAVRAADSPPGLAMVTQRPRVLVVDDELTVAQMLERILAKDCDVTVTNHGKHAIELLSREQQAPFDLIFCDLMMPDPSGDVVYGEVVKARPELAERFIFMTGGAFTPHGRQFLDTAPVTVLEKPFDLGRLRALIAARTKPSPGPHHLPNG